MAHLFGIKAIGDAVSPLCWAQNSYVICAEVRQWHLELLIYGQYEGLLSRAQSGTFGGTVNCAPNRILGPMVRHVTNAIQLC